MEIKHMLKISSRGTIIVLETFLLVIQGFMKHQEVDVPQFRQTVGSKTSWIDIFLQILNQEKRAETF